MKKTSISLLMLICAYSMSHGQEEDGEAIKERFWEFRTGVTIERFQDLKASGLVLNGTAVPIGIQKGWGNENSKSQLGLDLRFGLLGPSANSTTELSSAVISLGYQRLKKVSKAVPVFDHWYLGGRFDFRIQRLNNEALGNSANNAIYNAGFSVVNYFEKPVSVLKKDVKLSFSLSLALLNYTQEDNSLTFSAPQAALEDGEFNTQDFENGLFKYGEFTTINKFNNIQTRIALAFPAKRRSSWTVAYDWQLVKYQNVKNYAATSASHTLSIIRHLPKKK